MSRLDRFARFAERSGLLRTTSAIQRRRPARHLGALGYHRIAERNPEEAFSDGIIDATPAEFRRHLMLIRRHGYGVGMEAVRSLDRGERLEGSPLMVTFDDGYRSCVDVALPLLQELGLTATFFIPTAFIEERRLFWWDQLAYLLKTTRVKSVSLTAPWDLHLDTRDRARATLLLASRLDHEPGLDQAAWLAAIADALEVPWNRDLERRFADELLMNWDDVVRLHEAGMDVQSHTVSHRILQTVPVDELGMELSRSRQQLEQRLGASVDALAYPSGYPIRDDPNLVAAVSGAGYRFGFTYGGGASSTRAFEALSIKRMAVDQEASPSMAALQIAWPSWSHEGARARRYARPGD